MPRIGRSRRRSTPKRSIWDCRPARPRWSGARRRSRRNGAVTDFAHIRIDRHEGGIAAVVVARADIGNASSPEMLGEIRSEEHTSELQSLMRISYAVFCLTKQNKHTQNTP